MNNESEAVVTEDLVILVHGTFATGESGWTSVQDDFHRKLNLAHYSLTGKFLTICPFKWSGGNSLDERQSAASILSDTLNANHSKFKRLHLIGHSHGGTVIQFAFEQTPFLSSDEWKGKVASWTTVGTPFYKYKGNLKLTDKRIFQISGPVAFFISGFVPYFFRSSNKIVLAIAVFGVFFIIYRIIENLLLARSIQYRIDRVNSLFNSKWFGVISKFDEAIVLLRNSINFNLPQDKFPRPSIGSNVDLVTITIRYFPKVAFFVIKFLFRPFLSKRLRNYTTGIDLPFYKVSEVNHAPANNKNDPQLPKGIDDSILMEVIEDNKEKIERLRTTMDISTIDIFEKISKMPEDQQPKLVHSMYFKNDDIVKAIAYNIMRMNKKFKPIDWSKFPTRWGSILASLKKLALKVRIKDI